MGERFIIEESENQCTIFDEGSGDDDYYHLGRDKRDVKGICKLLNEQHEVIQRLEKENWELRNERDKLTQKLFTYTQVGTPTREGVYRIWDTQRGLNADEVCELLDKQDQCRKLIEGYLLEIDIHIRNNGKQCLKHDHVRYGTFKRILEEILDELI